MKHNHEHLKKLVFKGAENKKIAITENVLDRISYELSVIEEKDFTDYFILYSRIIEICNELNLLRSFGRGSAINSMVNFCLDITKINPIDENLIFERFVSPHQKQLPDIDIDIPKGYQKIVIDLLKSKYPQYKTYYIAFLPQRETNYMDIVYNNVVYKKHPCGIAITTEKLTNSIFLYKEQEFYLAHSGSYDPIYDNKIDILELEYLNKLQLIVDQIGEEHHPYKLPLNDKDVFILFASGDLDNIFQFYVNSTKKIFKDFKPSSIYDLSIINAMFRPKLVDYIPRIIAYKNIYEKPIHFSDVRVSEILKETYGWLIYQETFLHIAKEIAGMSFSEADIWRKKVIKDRSNTEIIAFCDIFTRGCREHSTLNEADISKLTDMIVKMLLLTFQRTHALSYSIIGYWGAYYKTHFRTHFDKVFNDGIINQKF